MEPSRPNSELTLTQVKGILSALSSYTEHSTVQNGHVDIYISGRTISPVSREPSSLLEKIRNYMSQFTGWSQDLSSLPDLVRKIDLFISYGPESEVNLIEEQELQKATAGLGIVLQDKSSKSENDPNLRFIEQALGLLIHINQRFGQQRKQQAALFAEKLPIDRDTPLRTSVNSSILSLNPFSYFFYPSSPQIVPLKKEKGSVVEPLSEPSIKVAPAKEESTTLSSVEVQMLKSIYKPEKREDTQELKQEIREYLTNPTMNTLKEYQNAKRDIKINIPKEFVEDLKRMILVFNGSLLYDLKKDDSVKDPIEVCKLLRDKLGQRPFEKIAVLLNQGVMANVWAYLDSEKKPAQWQEETSPYKGFYIANWPPTICSVYDRGEDIQVNTKIIFVLRDNRVAEGSKGTPRGFIAFERQILLPKAELQEDFQGLSMDKIAPNIHVREQFSEFCLSPLEAEKQLQVIPQRSRIIEIWQFLWGQNKTA